MTQHPKSKNTTAYFFTRKPTYVFHPNQIQGEFPENEQVENSIS